MTNFSDPSSLIGKHAVDSAGDKIGTIEQVYLNDASGEPEWVTVKTGLFGAKESFAPLQGATDHGNDVQLAVTKAVVKGAPNVDNDGHTDEDEQKALWDYYAGQLGWNTQSESSADYDYRSGNDDREDLTGQSGIQGRDTSGKTTDDAMTRSEERLRVGTQQVEAGRAKLRKYIVTENVTQTVPLRHEEVRLEREPITDANVGNAMAGGDITEEEHEITLHAERPVVAKETVPVERVRLATQTVTENQEVTETLRKEQIDDVDIDVDRSNR
jgi:uncharacterized protein (TIGR02271 family)